MGYLADRLPRLRASREAKKFAKKVRPGDTWYSIVECHDWIAGSGSMPRYQTWRFKKPGWPGIWPEADGMSAELVWLRYGPLLPDRPTWVRDLHDLDGSAFELECKYAEMLEKRARKAIS